MYEPQVSRENQSHPPGETEEAKMAESRKANPAKETGPSKKTEPTEQAGRAGAAKKNDVVDLLLEQHQRINQLLNRLATATGQQKRTQFRELVRLLTAHESAEEEILHPVARIHQAEGDKVVRSRLREEHETKEDLAELVELGLNHPDFDIKLAELADTFRRHARHEEDDEFPDLRRNLPPERLRRMAAAVQAAENTAPTRPHPGTGESAAAQLLLGTPVAMLDRLRDAVRG
jgi:hemerythrin superfamily protein